MRVGGGEQRLHLSGLDVAHTEPADAPRLLGRGKCGKGLLERGVRIWGVGQVHVDVSEPLDALGHSLLDV